MVGTTDEKCDIKHHVEVPQNDINFITNELKLIFGNDFDYQNNMVAAWAGIRPLVSVGKEGEFVVEKDKIA